MREVARIMKVENGFTVRLNAILEDGVEARLTYVYEDNYEDAEDYGYVVSMLYDVLEYFGLWGKLRVVEKRIEKGTKEEEDTDEYVLDQMLEEGKHE